jgi:tetratricopeptide (TPR) repeat protein
MGNESDAKSERNVSIGGDATGNLIVTGDHTQIIQPASFTPPSLHQIKSPPRDFVGRDKEIAELLQACEKGGVNISGLSGVGKTALAYKLAEHLEPRYSDAQFYLNLRGASNGPLSAADAMTRIIRSIHPDAQLPEDESSLQAIYLSELKGTKALLLLDDAASAEQINPLIPPVDCVLLITSRFRFTLDGLFSKKLDTLEPDDAQQLLLKIAPRIGDYAVTLAELCGYLPLALKVAASVVNKAVNLTPLVHIKRLEKRTKRLELVEASLTLSYDLLSIPMQKLWRSLAVFPNTFDDNAVAAVWGMQIEDAQDQLAELISYSLIEWNETTHRYRLHDLVRLFADDRLRGEVRYSVMQIHATYFQNLLAQTDKIYLKGNDEMMRGLALFDIERENIEAGQDWAASLSSKDEIAAKLSILYYLHGVSVLHLRLHPHKSINWLEVSLTASRLLNHKPSEGAILGNLGGAYLHLGEYRKALNFFEQSLEIVREIGDRRSEASLLGNIGSAFGALGENRKAIDFFEQSLEIAREVSDQSAESKALDNIGLSYRNLGENYKAIEFQKQSLEIARQTGDRKRQSDTLCNLGGAYGEVGENHKAIELFANALLIARELGDRRTEGIALSGLGCTYGKLGESDKAIAFIKQDLEITRLIGDRKNEGTALGNLGSAYEELGEVSKAIEFYEQQLIIARSIGDRKSEGNALWNLAFTYSKLRDSAKAISFAELALEIYEQIESPEASKVRSKLAKWKSEQA